MAEQRGVKCIPEERVAVGIGANRGKVPPAPARLGCPGMPIYECLAWMLAPVTSPDVLLPKYTPSSPAFVRDDAGHRNESSVCWQSARVLTPSGWVADAELVPFSGYFPVVTQPGPDQRERNKADDEYLSKEMDQKNALSIDHFAVWSSGGSSRVYTARHDDRSDSRRNRR